MSLLLPQHFFVYNRCRTEKMRHVAMKSASEQETQRNKIRGQKLFAVNKHHRIQNLVYREVASSCNSTYNLKKINKGISE